MVRTKQNTTPQNTQQPTHLHTRRHQQNTRKHKPTNTTTPLTRTAYYARSNQGSNTHLNNQIQTLKQKYEPTPDYTIKDKASGLNEHRKGLQKLITLATNHQITDIYITTPDRLTRFGYTYLETLFNKDNVTIHHIEQNKDQTMQDELMSDFMALIASFSGRFYKMRSNDNKKRLLKEAQDRLNHNEQE